MKRKKKCFGFSVISSYEGEWMEIWDFNKIVASYKHDGRKIIQIHESFLKNLMDNCNGIDLGAFDPKFTWKTTRVKIEGYDNESSKWKCCQQTIHDFTSLPNNPWHNATRLMLTCTI